MTHPIAIPPTLMTVPMYSSMFSKYNFRKYTDNMTVFLFFSGKYIGRSVVERRMLIINDRYFINFVTQSCGYLFIFAFYNS